jgi:tetratricopeptide (TPR) repeat protein
MGDGKGFLLGLLLLGALFFPGSAWGVTPYDDVLVKQGLQQLEQENYDEALEALTQAWEKGAHTPEKAFYIARVYRARLEYPKAQKFLEEALRLKPDYHEARLLLADTLVALEQYNPALEQLKKLEEAGYEPGNTAMLQGMVAVKQKQPSKALDYFRIAERDPKLAQDAKLQIGIILAGQNRVAEAQKVIKESVSIAPSTPTGEIGQRYVNMFDRLYKDYRPFRFLLTTGWDYDSNVTLSSGGTTQVSGRSDAVYTQTATLEYTFGLGNPWSLLVQYLYFQNFHPKITSYDMMNQTVGVAPIYTTENGRLFLPANYYYTDVASSKYYTAYFFTPTYLYLLSPKVGLETGMQFARKYYWNATNFPQDDRSAHNLGTSLGLYYFLKEREGYLLARFIFERDFAFGQNWVNNTFRLFLAALYPVTTRFKVSAFLDLGLQPYDYRFYNGATFQDPRNDKILILGLSGTYNIYKGLEFNAHYYFVRDASNVALYDYHRHIVGAQLGYRY